MEEKIKTILRHQYPDKYEELHEQTAELLCALFGVVEPLFCDCSQAKGVDMDEEGFIYCIECQKHVGAE